MVDLAADQLGIDPAELRRRNTIPPSALPFKSSVTFTYDCGEFEKNMNLALEAADKRGFEARRTDSRRRGKLRGLGFSNTIERSAAAGLEGAEIRFDRTGSVSIFSGSINQGQGHETAFKQIVCDRLGLDPNEVTYIQGDTDQVFFAEGTGGSRSATMSGSAFTLAAEKIETKAKAIAANMLKVDLADIKFADGVFSSQKTNQTLTIKEVAKASIDPKNFPEGMEVGLISTAIYQGKVASPSVMVAMATPINRGSHCGAGAERHQKHPQKRKGRRLGTYRHERRGGMRSALVDVRQPLMEGNGADLEKEAGANVITAIRTRGSLGRGSRFWASVD